MELLDEKHHSCAGYSVARAGQTDCPCRRKRSRMQTGSLPGIQAEQGCSLRSRAAGRIGQTGEARQGNEIEVRPTAALRRGRSAARESETDLDRQGEPVEIKRFGNQLHISQA